MQKTSLIRLVSLFVVLLVYVCRAGYWPTVSGDPSQPIWTIYLLSAAIDGQDLGSGDQIAIFDGDQLVGSTRLTAPLTGELDASNSLLAWKVTDDNGGYAPGRPYTIKIWAAGREQEYPATVEFFDFGDPDLYVGDTFAEGNRNSIIALTYEAYHVINLTADPEEGGSVTGGGEYKEGETITVTATANDGYGFVGWSEHEQVVATDPEYEFTVTGDRELRAGFLSFFGGGSGTAEDPWRIATREQLEAVNYHLSAHYLVVNDIDLGGKAYTQAIIAPDPESSFLGSLDGDGHVLFNYTIDQPNRDYMGLFGVIGGSGEVFDLGLKWLAVRGQDYVGAIAGRNEGTILRSYVSDMDFLGSQLEPEFSRLTVAAQTAEYIALSDNEEFIGLHQLETLTGVSGAVSVGGLAGENSGDIIDSYALVEVEGEAEIGGLAGFNRGLIECCYAAGPVRGETDAGGLIGRSVGTVNAGFWDLETSGQPQSDGGTGRTSLQMKIRATFLEAGWDFDNIWQMSALDSDFLGYPVLRHQEVAAAEPLMVTVTAAPGIGGTVGGGGAFDYGAGVTVEASAAPGYRFVGWFENEALISTQSEYSFTVYSAHELVAGFDLKQYQVNLAAEPADGGTVTGGGEFAHGSGVTIEATSADGYRFVGWTENGEVVSTDFRFTFTVLSDRSLAAGFETFEIGPDDCLITLAAYPDTGGTVAGAGYFERGSRILIYASAAEGRGFIGWYENEELVAKDAEYSFTVDTDRLLTARFGELHPADLDGDWRISISEMTAYVAGWRRAENPINYAMRAVYIWRRGEKYIYDPDREGVDRWRPAEP